MSKSLSPSKEGRASALFMVEQLIHLLTVKQAEFEALEAPKNTKNESSSSNIIISPSNLHKIDIHKISDFGPKSIEILRKLQASTCKIWKFQIVCNDFYKTDIQIRAKHILQAPSIQYLCKSLLMKNTKCLNNDCQNALNSKFYLVLFQYDKRLKQQKLKKFVKSLSDKSNKFYKFSLAPSEETFALTSCEYNCLSPIGNCNIPIIVSHHIVSGKYENIWIGSGSLNVKLCINTKEFCNNFKHFVADITH